MRKLLLACLLLFGVLKGFASHVVGGEMTYVYEGPGTLPNTAVYSITLRLFRDELCPPPCAAMPPSVWISVYDNDNGQQVPSAGSLYEVVQQTKFGQANPGAPPLCVVNAPTISYAVAEYTFTKQLPFNKNGYTAAYQTCCRIAPLTNVFNNPNGNGGTGTGSTYSCVIPGTDILGDKFNNSPVFSTTISPICAGKPFQLNFSATDGTQGDSLVYQFCEAYGGGASTNSNPINAAAPPYDAVPYRSGYSGAKPMGDGVSIDPATGIISGIAPEVGRYVICVCAYEYRNGKLIYIHRKDFIVNVANCDFAGAQLDPEYSFCNSLTVSFQNLNNSTLNETFLWEFGDGKTSAVAAPTHTYASAGTYTLKLTVNKGQPCESSTTSTVRVYPIMAAAFSFAGGCTNRPVLFTDRSTTTHGQVVAWEWNFGDTISNEANPRIVFRQSGTRNIQLTITNSLGCQDTAVQILNINDRPSIDLPFRDTLICGNQRLQLAALGTGAFQWTPNRNITGANTASPIVTPTTTTTYTVTMDIEGCIATDSVRVRVTDSVTLTAMADTVICATDSVRLQAVTNGLQYQWAPSASLSNANVLTPMAAPGETTTYRLTASIGNCKAEEEIRVAVAPYPLVAAGRDTLICYGSEAQLRGSTNASRYSWTAIPPNQSATLNPRVRPFASQQYVLSVSNTSGCTKTVRDTVAVVVLPPIQAFAGNDTSVVVGQPLQLLATGGVGYRWLTPAGLSSTTIPNPVARFSAPADSIRYTVVVANEAGCLDTASIVVRVFNADQRIFVPTAFSPNGDGLNDLFKIIPAGISNITTLQVFNRWGQLVFQTNEVRRGWDGRINGQLQQTGTYVWVVQGTDFNGKKFTDKGMVTLVR